MEIKRRKEEHDEYVLKREILLFSYRIKTRLGPDVVINEAPTR